jgi:predicted DNA binding CopG/RHH family protein
MKKPTKKQTAELKRLAALPDEEIDTSDIPEIKDLSEGTRGLFAQTRLVSIRLNAPDIVRAKRLAVAKGLPYQTLIKSLLHEALDRALKHHDRAI